MQAVERQMVEELVHGHTGDEADVGTAAFENAHRSGWATDGLGVEAFDHRADIFDHHIAAGLLCQTVGLFAADDGVLLRRQAGYFRVGDLDGFYRHSVFIEERHGFSFC